jgi:hypothetical protein
MESWSCARSWRGCSSTVWMSGGGARNSASSQDWISGKFSAPRPNVGAGGLVGRAVGAEPHPHAVGVDLRREGSVDPGPHDEKTGGAVWPAVRRHGDGWNRRRIDGGGAASKRGEKEGENSGGGCGAREVDSDAARWVVFSWQNGARNVVPRPKKQFFLGAATFYSPRWRCSNRLISTSLLRKANLELLPPPKAKSIIIDQ